MFCAQEQLRVDCQLLTGKGGGSHSNTGLSEGAVHLELEISSFSTEGLPHMAQSTGKLRSVNCTFVLTAQILKDGVFSRGSCLLLSDWILFT